jgi:2-oxoglutarate dehydrogenase E1 component
MKTLIDRSAELGVESIVMGMAHRGRLNVLGNVVRKPLEHLFYEFEKGAVIPEDWGSGDVKYHLGTSYDRPTRSGKKVALL